MSYNIDSIDIIKQDGFAITPEALAELDDDIDGPEMWRECSGDYKALIGQLCQDMFPWTGESSGRTFDLLLTKVLPRFTGSADMVVCWEGGDDYSGIRVRNGVVTEHKVKMQLVDDDG